MTLLDERVGRARSGQADPMALQLTVLDEAPVDVPEVLQFSAARHAAAARAGDRRARLTDELARYAPGTHAASIPGIPGTHDHRPRLGEIGAYKPETARLRGSRGDTRDRPEGPYGIRTRAAAVRGRCPRPLDEWAVATTECSGAPKRLRRPWGQIVGVALGASDGSASRASIRSSSRRRISSPVARRS